MSPTRTRETKIAHFTLRGEDFTRLVRDFMLSELPSKAWRIIAKGLRDDKGQGGAERYAANILDGKMKCVGDESNMSVVLDNSAAAKSYIKQLKYIYAGRVRIGKAWYRPSAEVVEFGPKDARFATDKLDEEESPQAAIRQWWMDRVAFYGDEGSRVVIVKTARAPKTRIDEMRSRLVIFEPVSEPPHWWDEHRTPEAALDDFRSAGRKLRELRYSDFVGPEEIEVDKIGRSFAEGLGVYAEESRKKREKEEDDRYAREDQERGDRNEKIRADVLAQAAGDMMDLHLDDGTKVATVPRAPFICWAIGRTSLKHLAPPWATVAPCGLKLPLDDPNHTDWFYGATIHVEKNRSELDEAWGVGRTRYMYDYTSPLSKAADHEMFELQEKLGNFEAAVVVDAGEVYGTVGEDIAVIADLSPDHVDKIVNAKGIITETGGAVAHIAQLAMERSITIMRVDNARTIYPKWTTLSLQPADGKIRVHVKRY